MTFARGVCPFLIFFSEYLEILAWTEVRRLRPVSKSKVVQFCHMDLDWPSIWPSKLHCTIFKHNKHKKLLPFLSFCLIVFLHRNVFNHLNDWPLSETDRSVSTAPLCGYYKQLHQHKPTIHTYGCSGGSHDLSAPFFLLSVSCFSFFRSPPISTHLKSPWKQASVRRHSKILWGMSPV